MSGITGDCIVCGKFHATGHIGDQYVLLRYHDKPVLACPDCIPLCPKIKVVPCSKCGNMTDAIIWPEGTYQAEIKNKPTCNMCVEAKKLLRTQKHLEKMKESESET